MTLGGDAVDVPEPLRVAPAGGEDIAVNLARNLDKRVVGGHLGAIEGGEAQCETAAKLRCRDK